MIERTLRKRFFLAAEGESEQSFVKWLQNLSDRKGLSIHLDCYVLGGGGYNSMLETAIRYKERSAKKGVYEASFLLIDKDRSDSGDCSMQTLRKKAEKAKIRVCCQRPNFEGLLLKMIAPQKKSYRNMNAIEAKRELLKKWPIYENKKPATARVLEQKFSLDTLLRVAKTENDLSNLLSALGFL